MLCSARISCRLPQLFVLFLLGAATLSAVHLIVLPALKGRRIPDNWRQQPTTFRCNQQTQTSLPSIGQEFQFLSSHPSNRDLFTYSAYFDPRDSGCRPVVRVVGIAVGGRVSGPLCQLWYRRSNKMTAAAPAAVEVAPQGDGRLYESVVISCEILGEDKERLPSEPVRNGKFSVCVSPLHLNYSRVDEMVQTLEMNRMLGADHFFVVQSQLEPA
uniref:Glycosyltransferase family 92 protein n=1 Tax=Macrostomum lignano TaxID=282301 RepID=A0A1I8HQH3_9PLAT